MYSTTTFIQLQVLRIKKRFFKRILSEITKKVYSIFELSGVVRVDYMMNDNKILLNEVNTTPGSLAYYLFDIDFITLLERLIYEGLKEKQNRRKTTFDSSVLKQDYNCKK